MIKTILIIALVIIAGLLYYNKTDDEECWISHAIVLNQEVKDDMCDNCLHMDIEYIDCLIRKCPEDKETTLFFEYQYVVDNRFNNNDKIKIKWCYIPELEGNRVRGMDLLIPKIVSEASDKVKEVMGKNESER